MQCLGAFLGGVLFLLGCSGNKTPTDTQANSGALRSFGYSATHHVCAWIHEYPGDVAQTERAYDDFVRVADKLDAIHPKWWRVSSPTSFANHPLKRLEPYGGFHDERILRNTSTCGRRPHLMPLVAATKDPDPSFVHEMLHDPNLRRMHIAALLNLVRKNHYDGVDIDYEHFGKRLDPGQTMDEERAAFTGFIRELAEALHQEGKHLTVDVPLLPGGPFDHAALSQFADHVHLMGYDVHYEGGDHPGPTAPLEFINQGMQAIVAIDGGRRTQKFVLGLPNYGIVGPLEGPAEDVHMCEPLERCVELLEGRSWQMTWTPTQRFPDEFDVGFSPNARLLDGRWVFFDDLASLEDKVRAAKEADLAGITVWALGGEPPGAEKRSFFDMVCAFFGCGPANPRQR